VGLDKALQFVIFGPNGPDGKPGTADDLPDPFKAYLTDVPPPGEGGMSGMPADDLATLKKVRDAAELYAGDPVLQSDGIRRQGLTVLERLNIALDGWGAPGQKDWYLRLGLGLGCPPPDEYTAITYLTDAAYAARGRGLNYGEIPALWAEVAADCASNNPPLPKHLTDVRSRWDGFTSSLSKIQLPPINLNPMKTPATSF
jgi:hypothetical protein